MKNWIWMIQTLMKRIYLHEDLSTYLVWIVLNHERFWTKSYIIESVAFSKRKGLNIIKRYFCVDNFHTIHDHQPPPLTTSTITTTTTIINHQPPLPSQPLLATNTAANHYSQSLTYSPHHHYSYIRHRHSNTTTSHYNHWG